MRGRSSGSAGSGAAWPRPRAAHLLRSALLLLLLLPFLLLLAAGCEHGGGGGPDPLDPPGDQPAFPFPRHVDQRDIASGKIQFAELFALGDELFEVKFNALDGVGARALPDGTTLSARFTRFPPGGGRFAGPNAQACVGCHNSPFPTSAGEAAASVLQDPAGDGRGPFNLRNTTSLFGSAVLQRLAEEITEDLHAIRDVAALAAVPGGAPVALDLVSKGISYGRIAARRDASGTVSFDTSEVRGVDPDLVVRPYGWKGNVTTLRDFVRGAARNELGMEPDELVAKGLCASEACDPDDPDGDGVVGELSAGDITAIAIYVGAQEVPVAIERLVRQGLAPPLPTDRARLAERGRALFSAIGCAECHRPELRLEDPVFEEPTLRGRGNYLDPDLIDAFGVDPARPFRFHLVREGDRPRLEPHPQGGARVALFGDLRRHHMGAQLADAQDTPVTGADGRPTGAVVPAATFLTAELWGVGNTGPWLHDGRAGTLEEAILLHGVDAPPPPGHPARSEAQDARDAFVALAAEDRLAVVEFLRGLVLFAFEEEEE